MKRWIAMILMLVLLTGCSGKKDDVYEPENPRLTFTDSTGYFVTAPERPQRVAVLDDTLARLWEMAGGTVYPQEYSSKPDFMIASAKDAAQVDTCKSARESGVPGALFSLNSFQDYLRILDIFTMITQDDDAYITYGIRQREAVEEITQSVSVQQAVKVQVIRDGQVQTDDFVCAMLKDLGAEIVAEAPQLVFQIGEAGQEQTVPVAVLDGALFGAVPLDRWAEAYSVLAEELKK